ncbi:hypothetical protein E8E14_004143 [Neopestalotiopsis sp. 37M]|nr:hypothetical protein E8E14_004143 [Neopestalotiopsis sp. 37M]
MPQPPRELNKREFPGSSAEEIENEPVWHPGHNHRVGFRNNQNRFAGLTEDNKDHWDNVEEKRLAEEGMKKYRKLRMEYNRGDLLNFQNVMQGQTDFHKRDPKNYPPIWHFVVNSTEEFIKNEQDWPANLELRKEKEEAKSNRDTRSDTEESSQESQEQSMRSDSDKDNHAEDDWRQNRGGIDTQDTMTPDNWVPRSANLIRQTGQHPLNAEPRLADLFEAGLITPNKLHYVRSHGSVPRLFWETHILDINNGQMRLTMDDLVHRFEPINISMAMACDAVRRGELNMIRKTKGFSWGPGAMSNAFWKGARLADVLKAAGISRDNLQADKRLYVHFEGADKPSEGPYATSVAYDHVIDPMNDVILAYEMNNTKLPQDHGFPVRVVIPGFVGARCVKWLAKIWISDKENDSHYHIWDNRVLPSFITEKDGDFAQTMFRHPDTVCYEQNLNSVVARPAQDETLDLKKILEKDTYRIEGIAYDGGGHKVQRVEVSLDEGKTWLYAIRRNSVRHGEKFWTWCYWHLDVDSLYFSRAESIVVRAFNVFKNTQPREPIWNIMGMMNNCWYRVKLTESPSDRRLVCRHPVDAAGDGGWMKPSAINELAAAKQQSDVPDKQFTRQEIEKHSTKNDCWLIINNVVYDATSALNWHPGGPAAIVANAGKLSSDVTSAFESIHDEYAHKKLQECAIGRVTDKVSQYISEQAKADAEAATTSDPMKSETLLRSKRWTSVKLIDRTEISEDTLRYTFRYKDKGSKKRLGLGTCQHIQFGIHMLDKMLVRPYTPIRPILQDDDDGTFDLVLKTYFPDDNQPGGAFSNFLYKLTIGEDVQVSGPSGEIEYHENGQFTIDGNDVHFERVNLIVGGSGITPAYQLLEKVLRTPSDNTQIRMVDANRTEKDILLKEEMEELQKDHPDQLQIIHVLSHPSDPGLWKGKQGHMNEDIIKQACFEPGEKVVSLLCGPPAMIQKAAVPALVDWGFEEDKNLFGF